MNTARPTQTSSARILVACIGNIFLGDDGFGVEVARQLQQRTEKRYPDNVEVVDFGIRGLDLAYSLLDGYDTLILIDAVARGYEPGTLTLIEPDLSALTTTNPDAHSMDPVKVLAFATTLGAPPCHTLLIGCEPVPLTVHEDIDDIPMELSQPVQLAVHQAITMLDNLIDELLYASGGVHTYPGL